MEFNLADLWESVAAAVPHAEAVVCGDRRLTYAQVDARANRMAHYLQSVGIGPEGHVAVALHNSIEYLETMLAAFKLRAVPINVNYRYVAEELRYVLLDSDAEVIVCDSSLVERLDAIGHRLPLLNERLVIDGPAANYETTLATGSDCNDFEPRLGDDHYIIYTGGTTGMPKGVVWRHEDLFFGALGGGGLGHEITTPEAIADLDRLRSSRLLPACPLVHGTAQWSSLMTWFTGGCIVLDPGRNFDAMRTWQIVAREKVDTLVIVGDGFGYPLAHALDTYAFEEAAGLHPVDAEALDVSCCTVVLSGGAPLSPSVKEHIANRLPGTLVIDGYGSSEAGSQGQSISTQGQKGANAARFVVSDDTAVFDEHLHRVDIGEVGFVARTGHIPLGYYHDADGTNATFPVVDGVRWSVPGDHARLEADGSISLLGRGSGSINTGGEKVYAEEVEAALKRHADVLDALVIGVPDEQWGERIVALVKADPRSTPTFACLDTHVRQHLAGFKVPRDVIFVDEISRGTAGKPDYPWARHVAANAGNLQATS